MAAQRLRSRSPRVAAGAERLEMLLQDTDVGRSRHTERRDMLRNDNNVSTPSPAAAQPAMEAYVAVLEHRAPPFGVAAAMEAYVYVLEQLASPGALRTASEHYSAALQAYPSHTYTVHAYPPHDYYF